MAVLHKSVTKKKNNNHDTVIVPKGRTSLEGSSRTEFLNEELKQLHSQIRAMHFSKIHHRLSVVLNDLQSRNLLSTNCKESAGI